MSDVTKCTDQKCPSRKTCYRYTAPSTAGRQAYADFNRAEDADRCDEYIHVERPAKNSLATSNTGN